MLYKWNHVVCNFGGLGAFIFLTQNNSLEIDASEQLSLWATTTEARAPRASALQQEKSPQWESSPHSLQIEKAWVQQ